MKEAKDMDKVNSVLATILSVGQGCFGAYASIQFIGAAFKTSRGNQQKREEGKEHAIWIAISVVGVLLITPVVAWLQSL